MWYNADRMDAVDHIRHDCDERDRFARYGWTHHDGRNFGVQELADQVTGVNITTEWVKYRDIGGKCQVIQGAPAAHTVKVGSGELI